MSAISNFLIKSAELEKEAKRGIVKYLERQLKAGRRDVTNDPRVVQYARNYLDHVSRNKEKFLSSFPEDYSKFLQRASVLRHPKNVLGEPTGTFFGIYDASPVGSYASQSLIGTPLSRLRVNSVSRNMFERWWDSKRGPSTKRWNVNDSYTDEDIKFLNYMGSDKALVSTVPVEAANNPMYEVVLSNNTAQRPRLIKSLEGYSYPGYRSDTVDTIAKRFPGQVYHGGNLNTPELLRPDRLYHGGKELPDTPTYTGRNLAKMDAPVRKGVFQDIIDEHVSVMNPFERATLGKMFQAYAKHVDNKARGLSWYAMSPGFAMNHALYNQNTMRGRYFIDPAAKRQLITEAKRVMDANYARNLWNELSSPQSTNTYPN